MTMITNAITTNNVPHTSTLRATPGVDPARASVVVSWIWGSECGSAIKFSSSIRCFKANAPHPALFRHDAGTVAASKNRAWAIAALTVDR
ncbi:hypothetical protein GCM10023325_22260 [Sphingomonas lutea]